MYLIKIDCYQRIINLNHTVKSYKKLNILEDPNGN